MGSVVGCCLFESGLGFRFGGAFEKVRRAEVPLIAGHMFLGDIGFQLRNACCLDVSECYRISQCL